MAANEPQPKKKQLSDQHKDVQMWKACQRLHMRDGEVIDVVKVLLVTRYALVVKMANNSTQLISKHAVDRAVLKQQTQEQTQDGIAHDLSL